MLIIALIIFAVVVATIAGASNFTASRAVVERNPNENEPDVFASPDADLDPESDTGEPEGWN